ncbi:MAG TPA: TonB-dependent siderophore receptor, partial [Rhodanobacter sp.]|nr:TonB-dependent siderophore receptor [Rhodanobacter sp.]
MTRYSIPLLSVLLAVPCVTHAQPPETLSAPTPRSLKPAAHATPLAPVQVTAIAHHGYLADTAQVDTFGSFGDAPLQDTPAAITVITRDQLDD